MRNIHFLAAASLAALVTLSGCGQKEPEVVDMNPDPQAAELAKAAPVELPPSIQASRTYRCKDNSLVYVTFFQGDKLASIRTEQTGPVTRLTAPAAGEPLTADGGWTLTGTPASITVTVPGKPSQTCRA